MYCRVYASRSFEQLCTLSGIDPVGTCTCGYDWSFLLRLNIVRDVACSLREMVRAVAQFSIALLNICSTLSYFHSMICHVNSGLKWFRLLSRVCSCFKEYSSEYWGEKYGNKRRSYQCCYWFYLLYYITGDLLSLSRHDQKGKYVCKRVLTDWLVTHRL